eukprot:CAMPEP_0203897738 /NCGR_PEP_ID=MMETSP0359-20131031/40333_1 /ASSEMBLY_ACC=CAM_ASM_000338 /TAXON_ID=268821 /ORGANISM="Scrippsiella Hangoei, Strain SHTV-5" /LENGTH=519 /DNA_ID=CAMNT_0050820687 /DNA_START=67 /DNA_END=1626 /DNA_ORIENTATION=+
MVAANYGSLEATGAAAQPAASATVSAASATSSPGPPLPYVASEEGFWHFEPGWPSFWAIVLQDTVALTIGALMFTDLGTAYFNGGTDPCIGAGQGSLACDGTVRKLSQTSALFSTISALICIISGPLTGVVADMVGTQPVLVVSLIARMGLFISFAGLAYGRMSVYYFFAFQELSSLVPTSVTYILWLVENTLPKARMTKIAKLSAVVALQGAITPLILASLPRESAPIIVVVLGLSCIGLAAVMPARPPRRVVAKAPHGGVAEGSAATVRRQLAASARFVMAPAHRTIVGVAILSSTVQQGCDSILLLFMKARFGLSMPEMARFQSTYAFFFIVAQLVVVPALQSYAGLRGTVFIGFVIGVLVNLTVLVIPSETWLFPVMAVGAMSSIGSPAIIALVANLATGGLRDGANASLATVNSIGSVSHLFGPLLFNVAFSYFLEPGHLPSSSNSWPGSPFALAIVFQIACIALLRLVPEHIFEKASGEGPDSAALAAGASASPGKLEVQDEEEQCEGLVLAA